MTPHKKCVNLRVPRQDLRNSTHPNKGRLRPLRAFTITLKAWARDDAARGQVINLFFEESTEMHLTASMAASNEVSQASTSL